jgi:hypothetical protein
MHIHRHPLTCRAAGSTPELVGLHFGDPGMLVAKGAGNQGIRSGSLLSP